MNPLIILACLIVWYLMGVISLICLCRIEKIKLFVKPITYKDLTFPLFYPCFGLVLTLILFFDIIDSFFINLCLFWGKIKDKPVTWLNWLDL